MIRRLLLISVFSSIGLAAWSQTSLEGKVTDATTGDALIFANVVLFRNGNLITGTQTDLDGNYVFSSIDPGTYDVEASYTGFPTQRQTGVVALAGKSIRLDFKLDAGMVLNVVEIVAYKVPLIEQDNTTQGGVKTAEQIRNLPTKNINAIAATTAGLSSIDGGDINIRGSRSDATDYYLDGIRINSNQLIPQSEIEQLQVITGGIEARYGDVTGGLISLTSKGPSAALAGGIEIESSELTDPYGYNLLSANLSGPILKNKETKQSIMGFRVSAQYKDLKDPSPRAYGGYRATEEAINRIGAEPLTYVNGTPIALAERLEDSDVELLKARPNVRDSRIDLTGKLDFKVNDAIDFTVGGSFYDDKNHFSPSREWNLLNWQNNPYENQNGYLFNARFRHRIGGTPAANDPTAAPALIRNISYTLQYGYEKNFSERGDDRYKDNLFRYGYVGDFDVTWIPETGIAQDTNSPFASPLFPGSEVYGEHFGYSETFAEGGYTPSSSINPLLNNYNNGQDVLDFRDYNAYNGEWSDIVNSAYAGIHTNTGAVYNLFRKTESDIHTGTLNASFDIMPGGSENGRHNIQFGLIYEQRQTRSWAINPIDLWNTMRFAANDAHIVGLDSTQIIGVDTLEVLIGGRLGQFPVNIYQTLVVEQPNLLFYKSVRNLDPNNPISLNDYVNVDGLNPDDLSLDMFAAEELTNRRAIGYYGYDYLGNKLPFDVSFNDFFTTEDAEGRRTLPVAANKPIYSAAYIQDKFTFKDIIFRLGLRVDRYDANTKVLKDPYSLYEIIKAGDFYDLADVDQEQPANVQDDWKVYVVSEGSTKVRAYRDGDQWYTSDGTPVNDGSEILGNEIPNPYYVERNSADRNIRSRNFDPNGSFEDYTPQVSWMPRLAFSFPISDEANFFVHYDILVQRPPSNTIATPLDYYYWSDGPPQNNPNLKPEKTIDFEVGFKQKVSNSSAITLSAYYKELRDMIQSQTYLYVPGVPGNKYNSYGNQDFGTVKGFSFSYDLRRTQNLEMTAAYTIQFADGTGSSATSQVDLNINGRGNLRYLSPLSFDERHRLSLNLDYRYGSGNQYNGPRLFGLDFFSNMGINLQGNAASGRPYTKQQKPQRFGAAGIGGAINGARLPWNFGLDMRIDKSFRIGGAEGANPLFANVYLRIENVFDARNIIGVYAASGSPYDDGFLVTPDGQSSIQTLIDSGREGDVDNYLLSYQWGELNPGFFTLPRRIYLGASLQF